MENVSVYDDDLF